MTESTIEMIPAEGTNIGCPACGKPLAKCEGHTGEAALDILDRHDAGDHVGCHPDGCVNAGKVTGHEAPTWKPRTSVSVTETVPPVKPVVPDLPSWASRVTADAFRAAAGAEPIAEASELVAEADDDEGAPDPVDLVWEEPEDTKRFTWADTAEALKANPGKWARVAATPDRAHANRARNALRYHGIETRSKTVDGIVKVWAAFEPTDNAPVFESPEEGSK